MNKKKTVLVTGVAGFIGQKTAELLLLQGYRVVGVDHINDYYDVRLKKYRLALLSKYQGFSFIKLDIEHYAKLEQLFKKDAFIAVINLAARAGVRYSTLNPHVYLTTNAQGVLNILELCRQYGVKKLVLASTSSLYAGQPMPFKETSFTNKPISPYAASKQAAESLCYTYHYLYGIDVTIFRYFTVYGPAGRPDMSYFRFIKAIDQGKPIEVFGDGLQERDFTYVDDIARGTILGLSKVGFEVINLGNNHPNSLTDMIAIIEQLLGKKAKIKKLKKHKADVQKTWADIHQANKLLGWKPEISLEQGLDKTVQWYLNNKKLVDSLVVTPI